MRRTQRFLLSLGIAASVAALGTFQSVAQTRHDPPPFLQPPPPKPPVQLVATSVPAFIDYASQSGIGEREPIRKLIWAAREKDAVAFELCRQIEAAQRTDHSRALIALSILGELRNPAGERCLSAFLHKPFPTEGTVVDGEIIEQTALGMLQAKAVDGLAYAGTSTGDRETLWAAAAHPSIIVRAEAISAFLWNHQNSEAAKTTLSQVIRPSEHDFLDRPHREPGAGPEQFNTELAAYAAKHPAPKPETYLRHKPTPQGGSGDAPPPRTEPKPVSPPPEGRQ